MKRLFVLAACTLIAFAGLSGCSEKQEEKTAEKMAAEMIEKGSGGKAEVDIKNGNMSIKTKEGEMVINADSSAKLPDDFPKDVFVIKGADVKMTMDMPQGKTVSFLAKEDMASVFEKYKKEMTSKGWDQQMAMNLGDGASLVYEKVDRMTNITIAKDEEGTMINVVITKK